MITKSVNWENEVKRKQNFQMLFNFLLFTVNHNFLFIMLSSKGSYLDVTVLLILF